MIAVLIIVGTLALIAFFVWISLLIEKKRTEAMRQASLRLGFEFFPKGDPIFYNEMSVFHLFQQGHSRILKNLLKGSISDADVAVFDYRFTIGGGKNQHTKNQTVAWFRSARLNLPGFTLGPENLLHKVGAMFGYQDIDFEHNPDFSKRFLLRGQDETRIRMLFNDSVLRFFEQKHPVCTEGGRNHFIFYRSSRQVKTEDMSSFIEEAKRALNLLQGR
jgi:hypothetical protein